MIENDAFKLLLINLFHLNPDDITNIVCTTFNKMMVLLVTLADKHQACPYCGFTAPKIKEYVTKEITHSALAGVVATDHSLMEAASCMGASRLRVFFTVVLPSAVPNIFTGIRLGLSSSIICVIAAEMLVGNDGLGYLIQSSKMYYKTAWAFAGIVTLALIGFVADRLLQLFGCTFLKHFGVRKA